MDSLKCCRDMVLDSDSFKSKKGVAVDCYSAQGELLEEMRRIQGATRHRQNERKKGKSSGGTSSHNNLPIQRERTRVLPGKNNGGPLNPPEEPIFKPFGNILPSARKVPFENG